MTRAWIVLPCLVMLSIITACGSENSASVECASGSQATYQEQAKLFAWPIYCPTYLPSGWQLDRADFGPSPGGGLSTVRFKNGDDGIIEIIQGIILITPRDESGLPIATPSDEVRFGSIPAELFVSSGGTGLVRSKATEETTRAVRGSPGIDPALLVQIAASAQMVAAPP